MLAPQRAFAAAENRGQVFGLNFSLYVCHASLAVLGISLLCVSQWELLGGRDKIMCAHGVVV